MTAAIGAELAALEVLPGTGARLGALRDGRKRGSWATTTVFYTSELRAMLRPFVFRRYISFSVIQSLRNIERDDSPRSASPWPEGQHQAQVRQGFAKSEIWSGLQLIRAREPMLQSQLTAANP
ncbi:hypothetical protein ACNKHQ_17710 [Shigella flexneri]